VIAFEPDKREFGKLENLPGPNATKYLNVALGNEKKVRDFYLTRKHQVSSIFKPNRKFLDRFPESERLDIVKTIQLETDTLDSQLRQHQIENVDFVKLDTQGSELFILQGARRVLADSVFGLEIEVEFSSIYEGQPLFSEVDTFVRQFGFQLFDLRPYYWKREIGKDYGNPKGQLVMADSLYLKGINSFKMTLDQISDISLKRSRIVRAISICLLYGYLDYALEIFNETRVLFTEIEADSLWHEVKKERPLSRTIPDFRGRGRIANVFYSVYKAIGDSYHGWAMAGKTLGNLE
jgi:FkbM family methyltransferase